MSCLFLYQLGILLTPWFDVFAISVKVHEKFVFYLNYLWLCTRCFLLFGEKQCCRNSVEALFQKTARDINL